MSNKKLFCEMNPLFYIISVKKETIKRYIKNIMSKDIIAKTHSKDKLPNVVDSRSSVLIKTGKGIDPILQQNKAVNIKLACDKINGIIIRPGETFSFWRTVGSTSKRKGYKAGRVIVGDVLKPGTGGGLCNLANTINCMVMNSPLEITEIHHHSDALAPDGPKRIPFSAGTSVSYNYIDYMFKNTTEQNVQLLLWCSEGKLYGEMRSEKEYPFKYELIEEGHHFHKEGDKYFRISKIYRNTIEKATGNIIRKELIWDNHSEVMFDYELIPKELIK